jgi:hypothetical protein
MHKEREMHTHTCKNEQCQKSKYELGKQESGMKIDDLKLESTMGERL